MHYATSIGALYFVPRDFCVCVAAVDRAANELPRLHLLLVAVHLLLACIRTYQVRLVDQDG